MASPSAPKSDLAEERLARQKAETALHALQSALAQAHAQATQLRQEGREDDALTLLQSEAQRLAMASPVTSNISGSGVGLDGASRALMDMRYDALEAQMKRLRSEREILGDQQRVNEHLRATYKASMLEAFCKRRIADEKRKHYATLLQAVAFRQFHSRMGERARLVRILTECSNMLNEVLAAEHAAPVHSAPSAASGSSISNSAVSQASVHAHHIGLISTRSSAPLLRSDSVESTGSSTARTARKPPRSHVSSSAPSVASSPASSAVTSPTAPLHPQDFEAFLQRSDTPTLRSAEDVESLLRSRRAFLTDVVQAPRQKISVLLEALEDVLVRKLGVQLRRLAAESTRWSALAHSHLQSIIEANAKNAAAAEREAAVIAERTALTAKLEKALTAHRTATARITELQHELHEAHTRRAGEEARSIEKERKEVSLLVERAHTLRRKVRDAEHTLDALEKKKARLQRQGFSITGVGSAAAAAAAHSSVGLLGLGSVAGSNNNHNGTSSTTSLLGRGIGGGGIGLLSMNMRNAQDDARSTQADAVKSQQQSQAQLPQAADGDTSGAASKPFEESKSASTATLHQHPSSATLHSSPSVAASSSSLSSSSHLPHPPSKRVLPLVTHASLGRLQLTLPIVPLYAPQPPADRTRPMAEKPPSASVGFAGVTGFGPSAGLRLGQRLDRKMGDFEKIAVQELQKSSNATASHNGSGSGRRNRTTAASVLGSSTGSVSGSASISGSVARFTASAYLPSHVPVSHQYQPFGAVARPHTSERSVSQRGGGGDSALKERFFAGAASPPARVGNGIMLRTNSAGNDPAQLPPSAVVRHVLAAPHSERGTSSTSSKQRSQEDGSPPSLLKTTDDSQTLVLPQLSIPANASPAPMKTVPAVVASQEAALSAAPSAEADTPPLVETNTASRR